VLLILFWIAVAICAIGQLAVLRSVVTGRAPGALAPDAARRRRAGEILWAVVPACMLAVVLVLTWRAMHATAPGVSQLEPPAALTLRR
jgi:heme/copper-type cytochrome/quinol oxidase subunit 2